MTQKNTKKNVVGPNEAGNYNHASDSAARSGFQQQELELASLGETIRFLSVVASFLPIALKSEEL